MRTLYAGQEATVRTGHETTDWFQIGKGVYKDCILSPCLFNFCAQYIMRNTGLDETQAGIRIAGRNINNLRYADDTTLVAENEEELKGLLMKVKEGSEKVDSTFRKLRSWHPVPSLHGRETVADYFILLYFLSSKITADGKYSHEIKRHSFFGRKVMTNLASILKSRDYFVNKCLSSQSYGFSSMDGRVGL